MKDVRPQNQFKAGEGAAAASCDGQPGLLCRYQHEVGGGGGGGPAATLVPPGALHQPQFEIVPYKSEVGAGGGGGPAAASGLSKYAVAHRLNLKRRVVDVCVTIAYHGKGNKEWEQYIGVAEDSLSGLVSIDSDGQNLAVDIKSPENVTVVTQLPPGGVKSFEMKYAVSVDTFFDDWTRQEKRYSFEYVDLFWCDLSADVFCISYDWPDFLQLDRIKPMPIEIRPGTQISFTMAKSKPNTKFRITMRGVVGTK